MFLTRLGQTWLFYHNIIPYHNPFLSYAVLLRYLRWTFIPSPYKHTFMTSLEIKYFTSYIFFRIAFFSGVPKKNNPLLYSEYPGCFGGSLFFRLDNMFYLVSFLLTCMIFRVLGKHLLPRQRNMFYHFLCFREIAFASLHIYYLRVFVLITHLQCNIFICLRYQWRTIFLHLHDMFFRIAFVSDTWEEPYCFVLRLCFSVFYLSQIS